ncbi:hypothetical protein PspLS_05140 [Pyricularia sp. CBS 133598]|nr:hypothetical protein PspLS_05140 [Pyricularia sp. CBS 133598]
MAEFTVISKTVDQSRLRISAARARRPTGSLDFTLGSESQDSASYIQRTAAVLRLKRSSYTAAPMARIDSLVRK